MCLITRQPGFFLRTLYSRSHLLIVMVLLYFNGKQPQRTIFTATGELQSMVMVTWTPHQSVDMIHMPDSAKDTKVRYTWTQVL